MYLILSEYTDIEICWYSAQLTLHLDLFSLATDISSNNIHVFYSTICMRFLNFWSSLSTLILKH